MLGLENYNPPTGMENKSDPVEMLRALGYVIPECREREVRKRWSTQEALRWYMRFRGFVGESRVSIASDGRAVKDAMGILERAGCGSTHPAIEALESRSKLIGYTLDSLSEIETNTDLFDFTKPHKIPDKPERMADLLREVMSRHEECDASMTKE